MKKLTSTIAALAITLPSFAFAYTAQYDDSISHDTNVNHDPTLRATLQAEVANQPLIFKDEEGVDIEIVVKRYSPEEFKAMQEELVNAPLEFDGGDI